MNNYTAMEIANFIIWLTNNRLGRRNLTPLKLQKILYYVQATFLAAHGRPLFAEAIQKWQYGPVVPSVYFEFKDYGISHIDSPRSTFSFQNATGGLDFAFTEFNPQGILTDTLVSNHITQVVEHLVDERPFDLVNRTHTEIMWARDQESILSGKRDIEYSNTEIAEYFRNNPIF